MGIKRNKLWTLLAMALAVLTVAAVLSQSGGLSFEELLEAVRSANPFWLLLAVICSAGYIFFEGQALLVILKCVGYPQKQTHGFVYGAAEVYFSAITPSASGGQPASAFFMVKDGIPGGIVTASLILNLIMYPLGVLFICVVTLPFQWRLYLGFTLLSRVLIVVGTLALAGLAVLFYLLLKRQAFLFGVTARFVTFLHRFRLMRHPKKVLKKLRKAEQEYAECVKLMTGHAPMLVKTFILNVAQRLSQFLVVIMVYLARGGSAAVLPRLFATQCYVTLGSNTVPIPGGMGVADYLMLDGYQQLFGKDAAFLLEMLSRSLSFYMCVLTGGLTVLIAYLRLRRRSARSS